MSKPAITLALLLVGVGVAAQPRLVTPDRLQVEDGDTLLVEIGGASYRVQLPGIDAPEDTDNPKLQRDVARTGLSAEVLRSLGLAATAGLRQLLGDFQPYRLQFDPQQRDRYGRVTGDLLDGAGQPLSVRLAEAGYAIDLPGADNGALAAAVAGARAAGRGLWGSEPQTFAAWAQAAPR